MLQATKVYSLRKKLLMLGGLRMSPRTKTGLSSLATHFGNTTRRNEWARRKRTTASSQGRNTSDGNLMSQCHHTINQTLSSVPHSSQLIFYSRTRTSATLLRCTQTNQRISSSMYHVMHDLPTFDSLRHCTLRLYSGPASKAWMDFSIQRTIDT